MPPDDERRAEEAVGSLTDDQVVLGGYRRVGVLQTGQNSEVWEVVEAAGRQRFAMKLLLPERNQDPEQRRMLSHEARVGMSLSHPKIIRFHKFVRDRHQPFILMEYFPAKNLKLRLMAGEYEKVVRPRLRKIIEQVGSALDYLHGKRWVHRDVKPDNILLSTTGDVRLIDFALAVKSVTGFLRIFARKRSRTAGTRSYMSPEQIRGQPLDARADVYSLGVMLYEITAGRLPFVASTGQDLLRKHLSADVPAVPADRGVTGEFEGLLRRMLAKRPQDRPPSIAEVLSELRRIRIFKDEQDIAGEEWQG